MDNNLYQSSIDWLFHQFPAFQKKGNLAYHPTLNNVNSLVRLFGIDHSNEKIIHVAGTNGKGSTCAYIASILKESGYRVGLFTSPHLKDFRERIRINGEEIPQEAVIDFVKDIQNRVLPVRPSFFELTWVLALKYFVQNKCDFIVVETGLGGRLDATNIIQPVLSVITNIGLDHQSILGETKHEIAGEKAGIIKESVPVLIGEQDPQLIELFSDVANKKNSVCHFINYSDESFIERNRKLALKAVEILTSSGIVATNKEQIQAGINKVFDNTGILGRFQQIGEHPIVVIDAAHNEDGVKALLQHVDKTFKNSVLHIIYGAAKDKDVEAIIKHFPVESKCYFTSFDHPRAMSKEELKMKCSKKRSEIVFFQNENEAFQYVQGVANQNDIILIFGSFFLIEKFL